MRQALLFFLFICAFAINTQAQTSGNALNFDGADDYIDCPLPAVFNSIPTNDFTMELWMIPTLGTFQRVVFAQFDTDNFASISLNSTGEISFYVYKNGFSYSVQSQDVLTSLELVHVAVTWSAITEEAKIFVNGNETLYETGVFNSSIATDGSMAIGAKTDGSQVFTGVMDELSIWSIAKTECEISFEMNDKKTGSEPNLVTYYSFDQGVADGSNPGVDELHDETSAGNDGTLMNFALAGNASNWIMSLVDVYRWWGEPSTVSVGQLGLVSNITADAYQWIYCSDLTPVAGATGVTFDPPTQDPNYSGEGDFYAVISTEGNCVDTSGCFNVNGGALSFDELELSSAITVFPNPSNGIFSIESFVELKSVEVRNVAGQLIETIVPNQPYAVQIDLLEENGVYFLTLNTNSGSILKRIVLQD